MAQADGVVANGTGSAVRSDINNQYAALWSNHSGSTEPSSGKVAYQFWADTNTNILKIRNSANNAWINLFTLAGGIDVDAASNFNEDVTFTGASYNLVWDKSDNALEFADNSKAKFGDDNDLVIYNTGSESQITNTSSWLKVFTDSLRIKDKDDADNHIVANHDGSVELYFNGSKKFETYAGGCQMGGDLSFYDSQVANFGTGSDLQIYFNGTNSVIQNTTGILYLNAATSETAILMNPNGSVEIRYDNTNKFKTESNGVRILGDSVIWMDPWQGRLDRNWEDYPSITITPSTTYGNQGEFRFHGSAGSGLYGSGSDFALVVRTDGTFEEGSDRRRKTNIEEITGALATVKQLTGKKFNIINRQGNLDPNKGTKKQFGLIAQECEDIIPEVVTFHPDENTPNENGWCSAYGLDYGQLTPLLINAIKELSTEVDTLKTKVATLEAK